MNVGEVCDSIENLLQVKFRPTGQTSNDPGDLILIRAQCLVALNNARLNAEREHDFHAAEETVILTIDPDDGASLVQAPLWTKAGPSATKVDVKSIQTVWHKDTASFAEAGVIPVVSKNELAAQELELIETGLYGSVVERYPGDDTSRNRAFNTIYLHKDRIYHYPKPSESLTVILDVWRWMAKYTLDADTDFFTEHGHDYMMWAGLEELNYMIQTFVPQQEGGVAPPTRLKNKAWDSLMKWDDWFLHAGQQPMRR